MLILISLFVATIVLLIYFHYSKTSKPSSSGYWTTRGFPSITNEVSLWNVVTGKKTNFDGDIGYHKKLRAQGLNLGGITEFGTPLLFVSDVDLARDIFIKDFEHFHDRRDLPTTDPLIGQSVALLQGQEWKDMRSFLSPTFTSGRIRRMFPHFQKSSENVEKYILSSGPDINISETMRKYTIEVIAATAFGVDIKIFQEEKSEFYEMAEKMGTFTLVKKIRFAIFYFLPRVASFFSISPFDKDVTLFFTTILRSTLRAREGGESAKNDDFLQLLVEARKSDPKELDPKEKEENSSGGLKGGNKLNIRWTDSLTMAQAMLFLKAG